MYKLSSHRDLNQCSTRQLTSVPGVDKRLAETIVRHRQVHGRFNHFDELWKIRGITHSKYQLLRRHFSVVKEKPLNLLTRGQLPYAKLSLAESLVNFVCQGKGKQENQTEMNTFNDRYMKYSWKGRPKERDSAPTRAQSGVPITKVLVRKTETQQRGSSQQNNDETVDVDQANVMTYSADIGLLQTLVQPRNRNGWVTSPKQGQYDNNKVKPSVILETSPDGDKINFTCSIDKRILRHPTSMSFQLSPTKQRSGQNVDKLGDEFNMDQSQEVSAESDHCVLTGNNNILPMLARSTEYYPSMLTGTSSSSSSRLSLENMMLYEKRNTLDEVHRRALIDTWIRDVNEARRQTRIIQVRDRADTQPTVASPKVKVDQKNGYALYNPMTHIDQRTASIKFCSDNRYKRRSADLSTSLKLRNHNHSFISQDKDTSRNNEAHDRIPQYDIKGDFHETLRRRPVLSVKQLSRENTDNIMYRYRMQPSA